MCAEKGTAVCVWLGSQGRKPGWGLREGEVWREWGSPGRLTEAMESEPCRPLDLWSMPVRGLVFMLVKKLVFLS